MKSAAPYASLFALLAVIVPADGWAQTSYLEPPKEIVDILDAPPPPR